MSNNAQKQIERSLVHPLAAYSAQAILPSTVTRSINIVAAYGGEEALAYPTFVQTF